MRWTCSMGACGQWRQSHGAVSCSASNMTQWNSKVLEQSRERRIFSNRVVRKSGGPDSVQVANSFLLQSRHTMSKSTSAPAPSSKSTYSPYMLNPQHWHLTCSVVRLSTCPTFARDGLFEVQVIQIPLAIAATQKAPTAAKRQHQITSCVSSRREHTRHTFDAERNPCEHGCVHRSLTM